MFGTESKMRIDRESAVPIASQYLDRAMEKIEDLYNEHQKAERTHFNGLLRQIAGDESLSQSDKFKIQRAIAVGASREKKKFHKSDASFQKGWIEHLTLRLSNIDDGAENRGGTGDMAPVDPIHANRPVELPSFPIHHTSPNAANAPEERAQPQEAPFFRVPLDVKPEMKRTRLEGATPSADSIPIISLADSDGEGEEHPLSKIQRMQGAPTAFPFSHMLPPGYGHPVHQMPQYPFGSFPMAPFPPQMIPQQMAHQQIMYPYSPMPFFPPQFQPFQYPMSVGSHHAMTQPTRISTRQPTYAASRQPTQSATRLPTRAATRQPSRGVTQPTRVSARLPAGMDISRGILREEPALEEPMAQEETQGPGGEQQPNLSASEAQE